MNVTHYLDILRRWWWLVTIFVALGTGLSLVNSRMTVPTYRTTTQLLVAAVPAAGQTSLSDAQIKTYAALLKSRPVLQETIKQLALPFSPTDLESRINVQTTRDLPILELSIDDTDPVRAANTANGLARVFIERNRTLQAGITQETRSQLDRQLAEMKQKIDDTSTRLGQLRASTTPNSGPSGEETRLQGELAQYQNLYFQLLQSRQMIDLNQVQGASTLAVVEEALPPVTPFRPRTVQNVAIGAMVALLLAAGIIALIEYFDDRLRDPDELRRRFNLIPLSILRRSKGGAVRLLPDPDPSGHFAEAMRLLRTNLGFVTRGNPLVTIITSAMSGEGKSTVAAHLALTEAQSGKRVVLIDADLRKPSIHRAFNLKNARGLSTFLAQSGCPAEPPMQIGPLGIRILTSGPIPPNPSELLGSTRMVELLAELRSWADVIIIDSVPILPVADALVLQRHVDGVVLVMDVTSTGTKTLERALRSLQQVSAQILGVVLNKDKKRLGSDIYRYHYRAEEEEEDAAEVQGVVIPVDAVVASERDTPAKIGHSSIR